MEKIRERKEKSKTYQALLKNVPPPPVRTLDAHFLFLSEKIDKLEEEVKWLRTNKDFPQLFGDGC